MRIYPLYKEVTSTSGILTETAWAGAVYNLVLYMLASHVSWVSQFCNLWPCFSNNHKFCVFSCQFVGAAWYLLSIEREDSCWHDACEKNVTCYSENLYCGSHKNDTYKYMLDKCAFVEADDIKNLTQFNFGIFTEALSSGVADSMDFPQKFFYCFWWGLRGVRFADSSRQTSSWSIFSVKIFFWSCFSSLFAALWAKTLRQAPLFGRFYLRSSFPLPDLFYLHCLLEICRLAFVHESHRL